MDGVFSEDYESHTQLLFSAGLSTTGEEGKMQHRACPSRLFPPTAAANIYRPHVHQASPPS
jgi:hypothetical protein